MFPSFQKFVGAQMRTVAAASYRKQPAHREDKTGGNILTAFAAVDDSDGKNAMMRLRVTSRPSVGGGK